jgi:Ca2+-binding RTX toxin-like protein
MRRRAILLMATMGAAMLLACGVAIAETFTCNLIPPCYGTPEDDEITGIANGETIYALGGDDYVAAGEGNDTVYGSSGNDYELRGEGGSDTVYGGGGRDLISADEGDNLGDTDHSYGGGGNDWINAHDGEKDIINCGKGTDTVNYDVGVDEVKGCERKNPT